MSETNRMLNVNSPSGKPPPNRRRRSVANELTTHSHSHRTHTSARRDGQPQKSESQKRNRR